MDLSKYAELFLTEGREHVAEMNAALVTLEQVDQGDAEPAGAAGAVAMMFRAVHSIKGMAAAMGYAMVTDRAHAVETLLDSIRRGDDALTSGVIAHLFDETDILARSIEIAGDTSRKTLAHDPSAQLPADALPNLSGVSTGVSIPTAAGLAPTSDARRSKVELRSRHLRVDAARLDDLMTLAGELEIARGRLERVVYGTRKDTGEDTSGESLGLVVTHVSRLITELREQIVTTRMVPVAQIFERFPHLVRETAKALGKEVHFIVDGKDIELDRSMLDEIGDPIMHLLRNALDHGVELPQEREAQGKLPRGRLTLSAQRESSFVLIRIADDGRGIDRDRVLHRARAAGLVDASADQLTDAELLSILTRPGFSTAERVTDISGRGVGLDVVDAAVRALGGTLEIKSVPLHGSTVTLRLPLTVAIIRALLARLGDEIFAIPVAHVLETIEIDPLTTQTVNGHLQAMIHDEPFMVVPLRTALGMPPYDTPHPKAVTIDVRGRRVALVVDDFVGQQDIVVKRFDTVRNAPALFGGATILSDGAPALIIDVNSLV